MTRTVLRLRAAPALRVDLRGITPAACAVLGVAQFERLAVVYGDRRLPLAELFDVALQDGDPAAADHELVLQGGGLARCDRIGWQMAGGTLRVEGDAGDLVGGAMTGGTLLVEGDAGALAAVEMSGGMLTVNGNAGDFAASTLPGSMDGMRGGTLVIRGRAGARFADRMRRGTALVFGDAGDFAASRLVAGTVGVGGRCGAHAGYGMRRGSVVFAGAAPDVPSTFVPAGADAPVFWQLLARDLARHGGPFAALARRSITRHLGDLTAGGKGELIFAAS